MGLRSWATKRWARRFKNEFSQPPFWSNQPLLSFVPLNPNEERIEFDFDSYVENLYKSNGVVFACIRTRQSVFSEARFQWQPMEKGRPGDLFGDQSLSLLERPWPGGTTRELLARMEVVASLAGNYYATTADDLGRIGKASRGGPGRRIVHMRPDWVTILIHSPSGDPYALDARILAYMYQPRPNGQLGSASKQVLLNPDEVCHYSPVPDPSARFRGMSWATPVVNEVLADKAATKHKLNFFKKGATLNTIVALKDSVTPDQFRQYVEEFNRQHRGVENAYETVFVGGGADVTVASADMKQLDFKITQGAGETRVAAAAGTHPVVVGLSEGQQGSSLNAGNFATARRAFVDGTMRHLWGTAAASLEPLLDLPRENVRLWYDTRDIAYLREDEKDAAEIVRINAATIGELVREGFTAASSIAAVENQDMSLLVHTGLVSVQLQEPGANTNDTSAPPSKNPAARIVTVHDKASADYLISLGWTPVLKEAPDA